MRKNMAIKRSIITKVARVLNHLLPNDTSDEISHENFQFFINRVNGIKDAKILEIGSHNVTGNIQKNRFTTYKEYVGFDYHPGENVDMVGDAHKLSKHLPENHFDAVFSIA